MRRRLAPLLLSLLAIPSAAQAMTPAVSCGHDGVPLRVEVQGLRSTSGNVTVTVYGDRPEDFLAPGRKLERVRVPVTGATTTACLAVAHPGTYAVAVYHDEDDDHDFDRTFIGLPAEGYGFSNDAPAVIGLPSFRDAKVDVPADGDRLTIHMRY